MTTSITRGNITTHLLITILLAMSTLCHAQKMNITARRDSDPNVKVMEYTQIQRDSIYRHAAPHGIRYTKKHPFIVVADWTFPPFSYVNDSGEPAGMIIEILRELFSHFHIAHEIRMMDRAEAHRQIAAGTANLMIEVDNLPPMAGVSVGKSVVAGYKVSVLRSKETAMMRSIMLLGKTDTVAVDKGSYTYYYLRDCFKDDIPFTLLSVDHGKVMNDLLSGKVKYFIWEEVALRRLVKRYGVANKVEIEYIDVPEGNLRFFCTDSIILHDLDRTLQHMQEAGQTDAIIQRWTADNVEEKSNDDLHITVFAILTILFTVAIIALIRTAMSGKLRSEFRTISQTAIEMSDSQMLAINVKRHWVYNIAGNFLPPKGISMGDYLSLIHPHDTNKVYDAIKKVDGGEKEMPVIHLRMHRYDDPQKQWRKVQVHANIKTRHNKPIYVYLTMIDDTEQQEQREQLDIALQEFSSFTERSDFGIASYDKTGRLINCNQTFLDFFCKGAPDRGEEFVRTTRLRELCVMLNGIVLEKEMDAWICVPIDIPALNLKENVEMRVRAVSDSSHSHHGYVLTIYDQEEVCRLRKEMQDTNYELAETKRKLEKYQAELRFITQHNNMDIFRWQVGNDYFEISGDGLLYNRKLPITDYVASLASDSRDSFIRAMASPDKELTHPVRYTHHLQRINNKMVDRYFEVNCTPSYDKQGRFNGIYGIRYDITDLVLTQRELSAQTVKAQESGRQKAQFLANMTHELRTPLNAINGFAEIMSFLTTSEEKRQYLGIMSHNCTMLINLVDNILQLTKIDTEGITIRRVETDFAAAFRRKAESMKKYINNPEVQYRIDTPVRSLILNIDAERVLQIFEAFFTNASKFTQKGFIHVGFRYCDGVLSLYCRDTGCGIPQEKQTEIFERFVKLDEFMQGTGLGLALCKTIADRMGATIDLYSREGEGTVISLSLDTNAQPGTPDVQFFPPKQHQ